jgi:preprotein translocase subunit Sec61beta
MPADVGSIVHPWYRGIHEWQVKKVAKLASLIKYRDAEQGQVKYDPKIMLLASKTVGEVLWFPYWISARKTKRRMKWGQRPPMLEEATFLELMSEAIKKDMFSNRFLRKLGEEIRTKLG